MVQYATPFATAVGRFVAHRYLRKPEQADLIAIKHPDASSMVWGALNEAACRLGSSRAARLTTVNSEVTNRCNLRCGYCPVNRSMARPKTDLPFDAFRDILDRTPTLRTLLPFQWGEPLLHPRIFDMTRLAADRGINVFLTSNGTLLDGPTRRALLDSGLRRLTISVDGDDATHFRTRGTELAPIRRNVMSLKQERDASDSSLRIDVSMVVDESTQGQYAAFVNAWSPAVDRTQGIPRMLATDAAARTAACREPWRGLLVVLADGRVTACCADGEGELELGNAFNQDPAEIFNGEAMRDLRRCHADGKLPSVCAHCTEFENDAVRPRFR